jgi:ABC-type Co2+ transport system permease subunit
LLSAVTSVVDICVLKQRRESAMIWAMPIGTVVLYAEMSLCQPSVLGGFSKMIWLFCPSVSWDPLTSRICLIVKVLISSFSLGSDCSKIGTPDERVAPKIGLK